MVRHEPQVCPVCEKGAIDGKTHEHCKGRFALDGLAALWRYGGAARELVKQLKYRFVSDLADEIVSLTGERPRGLPYPATLLPIPLTKNR